MLKLLSLCYSAAFWKFYYELLHELKNFRLLQINFFPVFYSLLDSRSVINCGSTHITLEVALHNNEIWYAFEAHLAGEVTGLNRSQWCSSWRRPGLSPNGADRRRTVDLRRLLTAPTASLNDATNLLMLHVCHDTSNNTSFTSFLLVTWMQRVLSPDYSP